MSKVNFKRMVYLDGPEWSMKEVAEEIMEAYKFGHMRFSASYVGAARTILNGYNNTKNDLDPNEVKVLVTKMPLVKCLKALEDMVKAE